MDIEEIHEYAMQKPGVTEDFPFDESTLVFRVMNKMFMLAGLDNVPISVNLKCDPERAIELREEYESVTPGYHMNKKHWNTVCLEGDVGTDVLKDLIDHSYALVASKLKKSEREELANM